MSVVRFERGWSRREVTGQPLRLLLVQILHDAGRPLTIRELIAACEAEGVVFIERASKLVSDTLRWEVRKKRVVRIARGRYRFGTMPRSTVWWVRQKVDDLRAYLRARRSAETSLDSTPTTAPLGAALVATGAQGP